MLIKKTANEITFKSAVLSLATTMHNIDSTSVGIQQTRQLFCGGEGSL